MTLGPSQLSVSNSLSQLSVNTILSQLSVSASLSWLSWSALSVDIAGDASHCTG